MPRFLLLALREAAFPAGVYLFFASGIAVSLAAPERLRAEPPGRRVVVWVRAALDSELRLDPQSTPVLRGMAREGVSLSQVRVRSPLALLEALRELGKGLGGAFREVGAGGGGGLAAKLGLAGSAELTPEEQEALERLREAARSKEAARATGESGNAARNGGKGRGVSGGGGRAAPSGGGEKDVAERRMEEFLAALDSGARLIVLHDPDPPKDEKALKARDHELGRLLAASEARRGRTAFLVVLLPQGEVGACIGYGAGLRGGRVHRREAAAGDVAALVAHLIGVAPPQGHGEWVGTLVSASAGR